MSIPSICVRNAARAVILRDGHLLLLRKEGGGRPLQYVLPGGAQELGETLEQALRRECREEIGCEIQIGGLVHVADHFKQRTTEPPSVRQMLEFLFLCEVPDAYEAANGPRPDKRQVGVEWIALSALSQIPLAPAALANTLPHHNDRPVYLGTL
jgi:ADP-ribose pyrophosphatase YjhB (NUDIX family)